MSPIPPRRQERTRRSPRIGGAGASLAELLLDEGKAEEARQWATKALRDLLDGRKILMARPPGSVRGHGQHAASNAFGVLLRALLMLGQWEDARSLILDQAVSPADDSAKAYLDTVDLAIVVARVWAASGREEAATRELTKHVERTTQLGFVHMWFEARLALGEIEIATGRVDAGRACLEALDTEATAFGWHRIARLAARARRAQ